METIKMGKEILRSIVPTSDGRVRCCFNFLAGDAINAAVNVFRTFDELCLLERDGDVRGDVNRTPLIGRWTKMNLLGDAHGLLVEPVAEAAHYAMHNHLPAGEKRYAEHHITLDSQLPGLAGVLRGRLGEDLNTGGLDGCGCHDRDSRRSGEAGHADRRDTTDKAATSARAGPHAIANACGADDAARRGGLALHASVWVANGCDGGGPHGIGIG